MSSKIEKILVCDRCGKEEFLLAIGDIVLDGDYTRVNKFEKPVEEWNTVAWWRIAKIDLCPRCCAEYNKLVDDFMGGGAHDNLPGPPGGAGE